MDIETAEAIDTLRTDIRHVEKTLTSRIDGVESSLSGKMQELHEDAKRHSDVQIESVREDIRILAEGFATLSVEVRSLRR